ncbi:cilia- and flagella-associated protein 61 isoform X2 [Trichomycterus rosablanca]|uniref:cilia- and flagella-associated protein 61 isoform X2 n=1 Tax=Trichomycterus rosablanca TaxID=2290929 RepID=UPI002F351431
MKTITSSTGTVKSVTVRRTESSDAHQITKLINPETVEVFGKVSVIHLLEKANLAVTISTEENQVLSHAAFVDHPIGELVDQDSWEQLLRTSFNATMFTPLNTLFLHLFVAESSFSAPSAKEIIRTVFNAITELEYICLATPYSSSLEQALVEIFEPMPCVQEAEQGAAFVCHRHNYCPRLHVRRARVEDHDDLTCVLPEQMKKLTGSYGPYFLSELIQAQDELNHVAVCEDEGRAVGFISVTGELNLQLLNQCFQLGPFNGLIKKHSGNQTQDSERLDHRTSTDEEKHPTDLEEEKPTAAHPADCTELGVVEEPVEILNAFSIQLFSIDKKFEMRSVDFLPYVFKLYLEREFCIIMVPKLVPEFPLLQSFIRAVPRQCSSLGQELYIFHRSGLLKTLKARAAVSEDRSAVGMLVQNLDLREELIEDLDVFFKTHRDLDGALVQAFVAEVEGQIVGITIIKNEKNIEYIRAHYNIENFVYFSHYQPEEHAQLCHFVLNPIFQHHTKHFLREVLRLAHTSCIYYPVYPPILGQKNVSDSLTAALSCMVPVRPRRQIIYPLEELGINAPSELITTKQVPYALYHINRKLTMEPKVTINARIVVVGASDTGLSFLEALVFCPHLRFNNLTLISTHGLPDWQSSDSTRFLATSHGYSEQDHTQLALWTWINVVTGKMTAIDRTAKHVQVAGGHHVSYDHLILCTGQQYQIPRPVETDVSTETNVQDQCRHRYTDHVPSNLFTLNDQHDCAQAYHWLMKNFLHQEGNAVVYGDTLDVYIFVEALLDLGVTGSRIHLVHRRSAGSSSCWQNREVERAVRTALDRQRVCVYNSCSLAQLNDGQHPEPLTSVLFTTDELPVRLECTVLFNFSYNGVDYEAFKAINDASLVFDGRLVIDSTSHTNDCAVRAAGPLTKFSRRYRADHCSHSNFNSKEVGQHLAATFLPLFDPILEPAVDQAPDVDRLVPVYKQPKITGGRLPGGYHYLHVTKPPVYTSTSSPVAKLGREVVTGDVETGNYFQLQFNQHGLVEGITCLASKPLPEANYLSLYGKHQLLLNHLYTRLDDGLVRDLYSYFTESWCMALYHDRFTDFEQEVQQIMDSATVEHGRDLVSISRLAEMIVDGTLETPHRDPSVYLQEIFGESEALETLKSSVLDYLKFNRYHLTMFAQPQVSSSDN